MHNRLWHDDQDGEIMGRVHELEIKLIKLSGGRVSGCFKMSGCFGDDLLAEDIDAGDLAEPASNPAETARFARKLMALFNGGRPPGAMT